MAGPWPIPLSGSLRSLSAIIFSAAPVTFQFHSGFLCATPLPVHLMVNGVHAHALLFIG